MEAKDKKTKGKAMKWDTEAKEKLFAAIIRICEVKISGEQYDLLAKEMGCTPKAITHVLSALRKAGKKTDDSLISTPRKKEATVSTPKSSPVKKRGRPPKDDGRELSASPKKVKSQEEDDYEDDMKKLFKTDTFDHETEFKEDMDEGI